MCSHAGNGRVFVCIPQVSRTLMAGPGTERPRQYTDNRVELAYTERTTMNENAGSPNSEAELEQSYSTRFRGRLTYRNQVWQVLAPFFSRWLPAGGAILDLGAGYCEFINNVQAGRKYAMDLNPAVHERAGAGVTVLQQDCSAPWNVADLDGVFTSNFLEHLPNKLAVRQVLLEAWTSLKPGGMFVAMGPNIRYIPGAYWDFFDHYVELTERSLAEGLTNCGFEVVEEVPRFLPYTMSRVRDYPLWVLKLYLRLPVVWPLFGKQFLVVARKPLRS